MLRLCGVEIVRVDREQGEEIEEAALWPGQKHKTAWEIPTDYTGHDAGSVLRREPGS